MDGTSCNDDRGSIAPDPANESHRNDLKLSLCDPFGSLKQEKEEGASGIREGNWVPSKMRFMRKMMKYSAHMIVSKPSDSQDAIQPGLGFPIQTTAHKNNNDTNSNSTSPSGIIRVCSDCNTTKTPLWRSGPRGPKVTYELIRLNIGSPIHVIRSRKIKREKKNLYIVAWCSPCVTRAVYVKGKQGGQWQRHCMEE